MTDRHVALAAFRAADPARGIAAASWPGAIVDLGDDQLDLVEARDHHDRQGGRRLLVAVVVVLVALCGLGAALLGARSGQNRPPVTHRPADPHQIAARALVHADLASFPTLPGSESLAHPPSELSGARVLPSGERIVSETRYWRAPGTITQVAQWFRAHAPATFTSLSSTSGKSDGVLDSMGQRYDHRPIDYQQQRVVSLELEPLGNGVAVRLTAWANWSPS